LEQWTSFRDSEKKSKTESKLLKAWPAKFMQLLWRKNWGLTNATPWDMCSMYGIFTYIYHKFEPNAGTVNLSYMEYLGFAGIELIAKS